MLELKANDWYVIYYILIEYKTPATPNMSILIFLAFDYVLVIIRDDARLPITRMFIGED
jgi:hypothetical protein